MAEENNKPKYTYEELKEKYLDNKKEKKFEKTQDFAKDYNMITSFMITIVILIALGVFIGNWLDKQLGTTPLFIILLTFLGIAAAYRNLYKAATANDKGSSKDE